MSLYGFPGSGNLLAQFGVNRLGAINASLATSFNRLSTGLAINRGADNPAGLIASEFLRADIASINAAIGNVERADSVLNTAEAGLGQTSGLLRELNGLVVQAANTAGTTAEERSAIQSQIDSILQTIDRIGGSTSFAGGGLLDGSLSYSTSDVDARVASANVDAAAVSSGESIDVDVTVTTGAEQAGLVLSFGGASLNTGGSGENVEVEIEGEGGSVSLTFAEGTSLDEIAQQINNQSGATGVEAFVSGTSVVLRSDAYGSDAFVSVEVLSGGDAVVGAGAGVYGLVDGDPSMADPTMLASFADGGPVTDDGVDVEALVNGIVANGSGTTISVSSSELTLSMDLADASVGSFRAFTVEGGGTFQVDSSVGGPGTVGFGLPNLNTRNLGSFRLNGQNYNLADLASGGSLSVESGNVQDAQRAITGAIAQVSVQRARIGSFQSDTLHSAANSLGERMIRTTTAESLIRDTDFAFQTAALARDRVLFGATVGVIGIANRQNESLLGLLG